MDTQARDLTNDRLSARVEIAPVSHPAHPRQQRFVCEVARRAGVTSWPDGLRTAQGILSAFSEWLEPPRRRDIAFHLPPGLDQAVCCACRIAPRRGGIVTLYQRARARQRTQCSLHESAVRCAAVLAVLGETVPPWLVTHLGHELPASIVPLLAVARPDRRRV
jgi:uncharacterized protein (DUF2267 family)